MPSKPSLTMPRERLITRHEILADGWTDADIRRCPDLYRVIHGVYAPDGVAYTHRLKCEAVALRLPRNTIITGHSAAVLHGLPLATPTAPVETIVSGTPYMNRRRGTHCFSVRTRPQDHTAWRHIRCATIERACLDLLAHQSRLTGVAAVDAIIHAELTDEHTLDTFLNGRDDHRIRKARAALAYVDGRAESPPESMLRITLIQAGLRPTPQFTVRDSTGSTARLDLAYPRAKVAVEYDGHWHADPHQTRIDEQRRQRLRAAGWTIIVVTHHDLHRDTDGITTRVRNAIEGRTHTAASTPR